MDRLIETERDRKRAIKWLESEALPYTLNLIPGRSRSPEQNRLQWLWAGQIAAHYGDRTAREVQSELKLVFGIPILMAENEAFAKAWAPVKARLTWEEQLDHIQHVDVSSILTSKQMTAYLDEINRFYTEDGVDLVQPDERGLAA
jgi:hypothetical protein